MTEMNEWSIGLSEEPERAENAVTRENDLWREEIEEKARDVKREVKTDLWSFRQ